MYSLRFPRAAARASLLTQHRLQVSRGVRLLSTPSQTPTPTPTSPQSGPTSPVNQTATGEKPKEKELNKHAAFYRYYSKPLFKMFVISFLTLQALKLVWSSLEDEEIKEKYAKANEIRHQKRLDDREEWRNKKRLEKEEKLRQKNLKNVENSQEKADEK